MRAGQKSDEHRERYLGKIAPFLHAASPIDSLSLESKRQIKRRVLRTLFRSRSVELRIRLMPVLAALGLLVLGGAAFATAQRLGLISPRVVAELDRESVKHRIEKPHRSSKHPVAPAEERALNKADSTQMLESTSLAEGSHPPLTPTSASNPRISLQPAQPSAGTAAAPIPLRTPRPSPSLRLAFVPAPSLSARAPRVSGKTAATGAPHAKAPSLATLDPPSSLPTSPIAQPHVAPTAAPLPAQHPLAKKTVPSDQVLFGLAMRELRWEHDPSAAFATLEEHEREYPKSALRGERTELEVEALLALHRDAEALGRLDAMSLDELPRSGERFVLRGELRASVRRWQDATTDFDQALARVSGAPAWHERALWGRGVTRLRCGEREAGLADIEAYRDHYPHGRFAAEAGKLLSKR
jgi:hypothetical protein